MPMALPCHRIGTAVPQAWHERANEVAQLL